MISNVLKSIRMLAVSTLVFGVAYTGLVTLGASLLAPVKARGSLLNQGDRLVGSELLAQSFTQARYFWPRPSAAAFATVASGASNQGPLSRALSEAIEARRKSWELAHPGVPAPAEMLLASGSGLDPHLSPAAAEAQVGRVAHARGMSTEDVRGVVMRLTEAPDWGFLGEPRVNILLLNVAMDELSAGESHRR